MSKNRQAIHLSNTAVDNLQSGNILKAFEALRQAVSMSGQSNSWHDGASDKSVLYRYHFVDCSAAYVCRSSKGQENSEMCLNEGTSSLLCLQALKISTPRDPKLSAMLDRLCSCGYAWVIRYNLALVSSFMGTRLGEKGYSLLNQAQYLFQRVHVRIDKEPKSTEWSSLLMSVLINQACIYHELAFMEARDDCLQKLAMALCEEKAKRGGHWDKFFFRYVILSGHTVFAPAA